MTTTQKSKASSKTSIFRIIMIVVVIILIGGGGYVYLRRTSTKATSTTNASSLQTTKATVGNLVLFASGTGAIKPAAESLLSFNTSGQVSSIAVKVGDHVEAGQVLAQLDDTDAKINLAQAQDAMNKLTSAAAIATANQTLAAAQASFVTAKATLVHLISPEILYWEENVAQREQLLADAKASNQTDTSDAAKLKVTQTEASLKYAQDSLTYFQGIYESQYVQDTFTQYRTVRTRHGTRTEIIKVEDTITGKMVNQVFPPTEGEIGIARSAYDLAKASIAEAQAYLDVLNGADISNEATGASLVAYTQAKHTLETAEYNLNATKLVAPFSGTISAVAINVGGLATTGSTAITLSNYDQPYVIDAYIDAKDWGQIQTGYAVEASFDIIPDQVFKGTVTEVYPTLDITSSNSALIHFTARLNTSIPYTLPAGSATSIKVVGGQAENAVLVPVEALHEFGDGKYALFVMQNGKLQLRVVDVGVMDLTKAEIISGLNAGEVVTTGVVKIK